MIKSAQQTFKGEVFDDKTGILFLFHHKTCGYSLEAPRRGASNEYPQHMLYKELEKIIPELSTSTPP